MSALERAVRMNGHNAGTKGRISRRRFIKSAAAAVASSSVGFPYVVTSTCQP
ncbi:MAG: twin-arginine translocation signal domain-containing protein [Planctomycetota bacterium]